MAEKFFPFRSVSGDRKYSAEDWAAYFAALLSNGVFYSSADKLKVTASEGMKVKVGKGAAFVAGRMYMLETDKIITLDTADGAMNRIDRIVLRCDYTNRKMSVEVVKGSYSKAPTAPELTRDADVYELALADVYVTAGVIEIKAVNITDLRLNTSLCGIVTGLVGQADTEEIFNQFSAYFEDFKAESQAEFEGQQEAWENEFNEWFEELKTVLDGDTATELANRVLGLENGTNPAGKAKEAENAKTLDRHEAGYFAQKTELEHLIVTKLTGNSEEAINAIYDSLHTNAKDGEWYRAVVSHGVAHSLFGGGAWYVEGVRGAEKYGWQRATYIKPAKPMSYKRAFYNGTWGEWEADFTTAGGKLTGGLEFEHGVGYGRVFKSNANFYMRNIPDKTQMAKFTEIRIENEKAYLGIDKNDGIGTRSSELLHTGNMASHVLPITGGTVGDGTRQTPVSYRGTSTVYTKYEKSDGTLLGHLGFGGLNKPVYQGSDNVARELLHTGNSAAVKIQDTAPDDDTALWVW